MSEPRDALSGNKVADATSFIRVLQIEPLARACMSVLDKTELPRFAPPASGGSGLKALRLISKGVNEVLMRNISGYTLILDGLHVEELPLGPSERSELPHLLRRTQLLRLTVVVMGGEWLELSLVLVREHSEQSSMFCRVAESCVVNNDILLAWHTLIISTYAARTQNHQ